MQATHDHESLKQLSADFKNKCVVMRKISSQKYESLTFWSKVSTWFTLAATTIFFSLSLVGVAPFQTYFPNLGIDANAFDIILKISSLFLLLASLWQLVFNQSETRYRHYSCVQRLSTLLNKISRIEGAVEITKSSATELAQLIVEEYDSISGDFPFVTNADHKKAKKSISDDS